jgi:hypothetical protein
MVTPLAKGERGLMKGLGQRVFSHAFLQTGSYLGMGEVDWSVLVGQSLYGHCPGHFLNQVLRTCLFRFFR